MSKAISDCIVYHALKVRGIRVDYNVKTVITGKLAWPLAGHSERCNDSHRSVTKSGTSYVSELSRNVLTTLEAIKIHHKYGEKRAPCPMVVNKL